jgi:hypothetical protein
MIIFKFAILLVLIGGVMLMFRPRLGVIIGLALVPVLAFSLLGTMFMAAAYLILLSVLACAILLLYVVIKALSR